MPTLKSLVKETYEGKRFSHVEEDIFSYGDDHPYGFDSGGDRIYEADYPLEGCVITKARVGSVERESTLFITLHHEANGTDVELAIDAYTELYFQD